MGRGAVSWVLADNTGGWVVVLCWNIRQTQAWFLPSPCNFHQYLTEGVCLKFRWLRGAGVANMW